VRGATYGTFPPRRDGSPYPSADRLNDDFAAMAAAGLNVVRTYTVPPPDVLDAAAQHGLRLLVGVDYDDWRMELRPGRAASRRVFDAGRRRIEAAMELCAGRPEVFAVSVGNEVPGDVVRVHGVGLVEATLSQLVAAVHDADPEMLVTYTNFPTTEYLDVEGQDVATFNVFLERPEQLRRYLRHLHIVVGDVPLVLTELGLAAELHGEQAQADSLAWQLRLVDECGVAGATVFSWTDEWEVAGASVLGWGFGVTHTDRRPKPAADVVRKWASSSLRDVRERWPRVSVVICAYDAAETIESCLASLDACDYPELEVIVCDDGSSDATAELARRFPVRVLELPHSGLSTTRNAGSKAATGEIVAFLDADAACHPAWPYHLALSLEERNVAGTGGPNLPFAGAGLVERAVAASPGGPIHVLTSDDRAEHVPGCNMAFRRDVLEEIGGFDPVYRAAGDDVDVCWKVLDRGYDIAFAPAAQVTHRRRSTIRAYVRQQLGYGRAERLVAARHRHRFNALGQARWSGFIYGAAPRVLLSLLRPVVYHGAMGTAPFQPIVSRPAEALLARGSLLLPLALPVSLLGALAFLSLWFLVAPALVLSGVGAYAGAVAAAARPERRETRPAIFRALVAFLHLAQPLARAWGRLSVPAHPVTSPKHSDWSGDRDSWLDSLARELATRGCRVEIGGSHDGWDLAVSRGVLLRCRVTTAVVWKWSPMHRLSLRPRFAVALVVALAGAAAALVPLVGVALLAFLAAALALEAVLVVRVSRAAITATTEGVRLSETHPARRHGAMTPHRSLEPGSSEGRA
jgi:GT2 family glycosyltransferase